MPDAVAVAKPPQPTEFPPPVKRTIDWLHGRFADWYKANPPALPDRFTRREFGFIPWPERPGPPPFYRHKAFEAVDGLPRYLGIHGPHSVYYSTAFYRRPGELKMQDKQWLGAELIFDLDADHLAEAEKAKAEGREMPLDAQLALVKEQFKRLLDEFLLGDFGLGPKDVWITFSGSRGYHAHVVEERLLQLDSRARREVVDYVTGKFPTEKGSEVPDLSSIFRETAAGKASRFGKHVLVDHMVTFPTPDEPGWGGRLARRVVELVESQILAREPKEAAKWLTGKDAQGAKRFPGIGPQKAQEFVRFLTREKLDRFLHGSIAGDGSRRGKGQLTGDRGAGAVVKEFFALAARQYALPLSKGETDEPVTADVKRLIRLPGSLHGKSGLKVVTLTRDDLDGFEPLRDATAFGLDPVRIVPRNDNEATLAGELVRVRKGEATEVPEAHAVFWLARQQGTVAG